MGWEIIEKSPRGGTGTEAYGQDWQKLPACSINKTGLCLNGPFADAFKIKAGNFVLLLFDMEARRIGIKIIAPEEDSAGAFEVKSRKGDKNRNSRSMIIACAGLTKRFPDCLRQAFRAHLDGRERVIEIDLSASNKLKR